MTEVSLFRLYVLRVTYLLMAVGLGSEIWPGIIHHTNPWSLMSGVARCLLAAIAVLAALGIRYPLKLLPLLLFEIVWKSIWLVAIALPLWSAHQIDADTAETLRTNLLSVVFFPIVIPWRYVFEQYVKQPGDRWL